jgi:hypothetical protein
MGCYMLVFNNGEGVEDFAMRLTEIVSQLATLGDPQPDAQGGIEVPEDHQTEVQAAGSIH